MTMKISTCHHQLLRNLYIDEIGSFFFFSLRVSFEHKLFFVLISSCDEDACDKLYRTLKLVNCLI